MDAMAQSLVYKCLSCPSRAIEEKCLPRLNTYRFENGLVGRQLICIEARKMFIHKSKFISSVICKLFRNERVFIHMVPVV
jgi:hypothetical protein